MARETIKRSVGLPAVGGRSQIEKQRPGCPCLDAQLARFALERNVVGVVIWIEASESC